MGSHAAYHSQFKHLTKHNCSCIFGSILLKPVAFIGSCIYTEPMHVIAGLYIQFDMQKAHEKCMVHSVATQFGEHL